jgi:outer membrane murein-binding lipoprotein Lpp
MSNAARLSGPAGVEKYVAATQRVFELEAKLADLENKNRALLHEIQDQHDRAERLPAWVEQLAHEYQALEDRDGAAGHPITAAVYAYCKHRLRERAKEVSR